MTDTNCLTDDEAKLRERLYFALNAIATEAGILRILLSDVVEGLSADRDNRIYAKVWAAETLVSKIGWIADAESLLVGGSQAFGDADRWFSD